MGIQGIAITLEDRSSELLDHSIRYTNRIVGADIQVEVTARRNTPEARDRAQAVENYHRNSLANLYRRTGNRTFGVYQMGISSQTNFGCAIWHLTLADDLLESIWGEQIADPEELIKRIEKIQREGFTRDPFVVERPDVNAVYWEPNFDLVCEAGERKIAEIVQAYQGVGYDQRVGFHDLTSDTMEEGRADWDTVATVYHLETQERIYDICEVSGGAPYLLGHYPNLAGRPNYVFAPGHLIDDRMPDRAFVPLIGTIYEPAERANIYRTLLASGAVMTGRALWQEVVNGQRGAPDWLTWHNTPANERSTIVFDLSDPVVRQPRDGYHFEAFPVPDKDWVEAALAECIRRIRDNGFPMPLSPQESEIGSAQSGYRASLDIDQSNTFIEPALKNVSLALEDLLRLQGDTLKAIGLPVTLPVRQVAQGKADYREPVTVKPSDFEDQDISVSLESMPASAVFGQRESDMRLLTAQPMALMSRRTFMDRNYPNPTLEDQYVLTDQMVMQMQQMAVTDAVAFIELHKAGWQSMIAADEKVPLAPLAQPTGGPPPGEDVRVERPQVPMPGLGSPLVEQGAEQTGVVG